MLVLASDLHGHSATPPAPLKSITRPDLTNDGLPFRLRHHIGMTVVETSRDCPHPLGGQVRAKRRKEFTSWKMGPRMAIAKRVGARNYIRPPDRVAGVGAHNRIQPPDRVAGS